MHTNVFSHSFSQGRLPLAASSRARTFISRSRCCLSNTLSIKSQFSENKSNKIYQENWHRCKFNISCSLESVSKLQFQNFQRAKPRGRQDNWTQNLTSCIPRAGQPGRQGAWGFDQSGHVPTSIVAGTQPELITETSEAKIDKTID